ncbi:sugar transferase [Occultella gossypii]|uniref:Sugar transferase n=1 Tax=Occultella gossypii TaxID=2800820 RepID=A0ABS7SFJ9_9MICO|nr:sugar transferase [Occultella gossypii]MBZ2199128.1 sugar transferase [Occultella gossypii]
MRSSRYAPIKRFGDVILSALALVLTGPLQLTLACLLAATQGRPVLFRQPRPGLAEEEFVLVKFRTMRDPVYEHEPDALRITRIGRILRETSLDELPSFYNVLVGNMSIVGPRPLLPEYLPLYTNDQRRRHDVRPGITGFAQLAGRNAVPWTRRMELDVEYVERMSAFLDASIAVRTLYLVIRRRGVSEPGHATSSRFDEGPRTHG